MPSVFELKTILKNSDKPFPHRKPAKHRYEINKQKCSGEQKIAQALPQIKREHHSQKKQEGQHRNKHSPLNVDGRYWVGRDDTAKIDFIFRH